jgi:PAS domain S-box-containing protein
VKLEGPSDNTIEETEQQMLFDAIASSNLAHTLSSLEDGNPLIYVNQAFLDETGYSSKEVIGKNCRFLQGPQTDPNAVEQIRKALREFKPIDIELLNYRKDGSTFLNRLKLSTVFSGDGKPLAYLGIQSNIETLVESVRVRQEQYKMEALGRLSANVSHEIKNALLPVRLMLDSLSELPNMPIEQSERCVQIACKNMDIAEQIVSDALTYSQSGNRKKEKIVACNFHNDLISFIKGLLPKRVRLKVNAPEPLEQYYVQVDVTGMYQVAANLVGNAVDAMGGDGTIEIETFIHEISHSQIVDGKKKGTLKICFSDTGPGVSLEVAKSVFEPFFSTKTPGSGTGLGLAISHKILGQHGGDLTLKRLSPATFEVTLPTY